MDDEVWSQSEATPVVQHFPNKNLPSQGDWQSIHPGRFHRASLAVGGADIRHQVHLSTRPSTT
jgi:hypothetical protein